MSIPKSLHTVTVVRDIAHLLRSALYAEPRTTAQEQVDLAFDTLGYLKSVPDPHDLRGKCIIAVQRDIDQEKHRGT